MPDAMRAALVSLAVSALLPVYAAPPVNGGVCDGGGGFTSGAPLRLTAVSVDPAIAEGPLAGTGRPLSPGAPHAGSAGLDSGGDELSDGLEAILGTDLGEPDSDDDGHGEFDEVNRDGDPGTYRPGVDTDPLNPDMDGDGPADGRDPDPLSPPPPSRTVPAQPVVALLLLGLLLTRAS
jgi:hypothetical protein